jgi:hypothetical protein
MTDKLEYWSYITLFPKKLVLEEVNDFHPISFTNVCLKFLTKIAVNRLQGKTLECIHKNQYGFVRNRSIKIAWLGHLNIYIVPNLKEANYHLKIGFR